MTDQQDRLTALLERPDAIKRFELKACIANSQRFVDDQDIRIDAGRDRKGQASLHATRIRSKGLIDEIFQFGKRDDLVETLGNLCSGKAKAHAAEKHVLPAGVLEMKSCSQFKDR